MDDCDETGWDRAWRIYWPHPQAVGKPAIGASVRIEGSTLGSTTSGR